MWWTWLKQETVRERESTSVSNIEVEKRDMQRKRVQVDDVYLENVSRKCILMIHRKRYSIKKHIHSTIPCTQCSAIREIDGITIPCDCCLSSILPSVSSSMPLADRSSCWKYPLFTFVFDVCKDPRRAPCATDLESALATGHCHLSLSPVHLWS